MLLDEIGRGTSTYDGVAIAWAVTEHLHDRVGCKTMFATHYHELMQLPERLQHARNFNVAVRETGETVVFLHRLEPGGTDRSYGIHVAQLAGLPRRRGRAGPGRSSARSRASTASSPARRPTARAIPGSSRSSSSRRTRPDGRGAADRSTSTRSRRSRRSTGWRSSSGGPEDATVSRRRTARARRWHPPRAGSPARSRCDDGTIRLLDQARPRRPAPPDEPPVAINPRLARASILRRCSHRASRARVLLRLYVDSHGRGGAAIRPGSPSRAAIRRSTRPRVAGRRELRFSPAHRHRPARRGAVPPAGSLPRVRRTAERDTMKPPASAARMPRCSRRSAGRR